ncbi:Ubiquitin-like superfamily protein [Gossypium australe]|uniref:Ubiquitin-like superfamily protein n=1 Tax=Gossypium australe TaxID=47621 RepID=A0A5B6X5C4_9ROSI|nr:Ubiquitin-like superfamily protein [Gossypium australe]
MEIYEESAISTRSYNLRVLNLRERGRLGSLKFNRVRSGGGDDEDDALVERQLLYRKLPDQHLLNLSVLKLDGSLFDVNIGRNATVAELKVAIEELFTEMAGETQGCISWAHVWGHFCLAYEGQKLVNNKACIKNFGIKDGDQAHVDEPITNKKTCKTSRFSPRSSHDQERQENPVNHHKEEDEDQDYYHDEEHAMSLPEFKFAHFLRRWLSHTRSQSASRRRLEGRNHSSRFNLHL